MTRPPLTALLLGLFLLISPGWAQPEPPTLERIPSPIDISTHNKLRTPDICYPVLETVPAAWPQALGAAIARNRVALLVESYEALHLECERIALFQVLAQEGLARQPEVEDGQYIPDWVAQEVSTAQALAVFARRRLHTLDAGDLATIERNRNFEKSQDNRAELTMLNARTYLDRGQMLEFEQEMDKLRPYAENPAALKPLVIGYHCLDWRRTGRTEDLLKSVARVIEVGETYKFGDLFMADVFWGDEVVNLARAIASRLLRGDPYKSELADALLGLVELNDQWAEGLAGTDWFALDYNILFDQFERYQGGIALTLATEKVRLFRYDFGASQPQRRKEQLSSYLQLLDDRHRRLEQGPWLHIPTTLYPAAPDLWQGSALQRLQARAQVQMWKLEPKREDISRLMDEVLALSPQEEALELSLEWADALYAKDRRAAKDLLARAEELALKFDFPVYRLLVAEKLRLLTQAAGDVREGRAAAQRELESARDLVAMTVPLPDGRLVGEIAHEASDYLATQNLQRGQTEAAVEALEQGQAIQSAHHLAAGAGRAEGLTGAYMREIREARNQEGVVARRAALGESSSLAEGKGDFLKYSRELQARYPELYDRTLSVKPLEFPRLQKHLPKDVLMLQYFPTDTTLYIFAMTEQDLILKSVELDKTTLDRELLGYLRTLRRVDKSATLTDSASTLYGWLLGPVSELLASHETVLLVPTGRLNYLPFASLLDAQGKPLAADHKMAILGKSSDLLDVLSGPPEPVTGSLMVVADPGGDLPAALQEGEALASLFPDNLALYQDKATNQALTSGMEGRSLLHLATHGEIDPEDPGRNYLLMAGGERLTSDGIFSLPLENVRMVTLSACNTALGQSEPTASVVSLAESFWVTGPGSVVATLWAVNDASTAMFMRTFYAALRDGSSKAQAMHTAQKALRDSEAYNHPYFWAPFVLLGDWR